MEAQIIVCGPPIHPSEPLYPDVQKQKGVSKVHKTTFLLIWLRPWPDFLWNHWVGCYPSVAGALSRNFIPYLEVGCNLAPVSGWLTWMRGNFHIILTLIPPIWGRPGLPTRRFSLSYFFGLNFYGRWTVTKWLAIFTYICVCMQCKTLLI